MPDEMRAGKAKLALQMPDQTNSILQPLAFARRRVQIGANKGGNSAGTQLSRAPIARAGLQQEGVDSSVQGVHGQLRGGRPPDQAHECLQHLRLATAVSEIVCLGGSALSRESHVSEQVVRRRQAPLEHVEARSLGGAALVGVLHGSTLHLSRRRSVRAEARTWAPKTAASKFMPYGAVGVVLSENGCRSADFGGQSSEKAISACPRRLGCA